MATESKIKEDSVAVPVAQGDLDAVSNGTFYNPHEVLGGHLGPDEHEDVVTIRVLRPLAKSVTIITENARTQAVHEHNGVFMALIPAIKTDDGFGVPDYRISTEYEDGSTVVSDDPYRYLPTIGDLDMYLFGEGRHERLWEALGARVLRYDDPLGSNDGVKGEQLVGTAFTVWAPNAHAVRVVGDFNGWNGRTHAMRELGSSGVWELFIPGVETGTIYKYEILNANNEWVMKADPMERSHEIPPRTGSIVVDSVHAWHDENWMDQRAKTDPHNGPVSIYEVHASSWRKDVKNYRELADKLVPYSLLGTAVTYALTRNATRAISILMVDFSCALKLSMPLAVLSAMRECGSYHITVKGGKYLEALANADTIVFDKTGTLTHATPTVVQVVPFGTRTEDEVLQIAACLEEHYPHSMANAVVQAAAAKGIRHDEMHSEVQYVVAHGIASQIGGEKAVIGSQHFVFEDEGCCIPTSECGKFDALPPEYSHLYLAIGGVLAGVICIADPLREEASEVLKQLRGLGIRKAVMMTGDNDRTASVIAKQVGVDHYYAEVLPEDKANFVEQEKAAGHTVIMLGDGINDSPALSAADVGIAISDGAAIAREIADVTVAADSLNELVILKCIANGLQKRTHDNYRFIMGFNSTLIVLGAMGILQPATSALLHNASTLAISLKSMTNLLDEYK